MIYTAERICEQHNIHTTEIKRFAIGQGNYVFLACTDLNKFVLRLSTNSYENSVKLLKYLSDAKINVSVPLFWGTLDGYKYMICTYIEGKDLGLVYNTLTNLQKKSIAKEVAEIQKKVAGISYSEPFDLCEWVNNMILRAKSRIIANGYFDVNKVNAVEKLSNELKDYFLNISPVPYLDDISTKNLLIYNGRVSGVIDVDWMGFGDPLTFVALTNMALLDMKFDTLYVKYLLDEMNVSESQYKAFLFYSLMYCVDFMGERGTTFNGRTVEVSEEIISKLNGIYEALLTELEKLISSENSF